MKHPHCLAPVRLRAQTDAPIGPTSYGRLFPELPAFEADEAFLFALGRAGGLCDCGDAIDDEASLGSEAAGWPFFGQFVAHDITADRSALKTGVGADASGLRNARSPQLNLECLYGDGPVGHPYLFRRDDPAKLLTSADGFDLLRNAEGTAIIGDPRNDSHTLMSQMHLAFVHAHNAFVDQLRRRGTPASDIFEDAARELRWHYQAVVLREFLPRLVGRELIGQLLAGDRRYYRPSASRRSSRSNSPTRRIGTAMRKYGTLSPEWRISGSPDLSRSHRFPAGDARSSRRVDPAVRRGRQTCCRSREEDRRHARSCAHCAARDLDW